jgi:integrase
LLVEDRTNGTVGSFVCELVHRSSGPSILLAPDCRLLSRPHGKQALIRQLRPYLQEVSTAAGISTRIVPHQLRHYAGEMVRPCVSMPALMKLLRRTDPEMTMRYIDVTSNDLQREFVHGDNAGLRDASRRSRQSPGQSGP